MNAEIRILAVNMHVPQRERKAVLASLLLHRDLLENGST